MSENGDPGSARDSSWGDRTTQQLVSYEALFKLLDEIHPLEDVLAIANCVAAQWKYFANVASWRLVVQDGDGFLEIDGYRGKGRVAEVPWLSAWDAKHFESKLPALIDAEGLRAMALPIPDHLLNDATSEINVLPFWRGNECIGLLSVSSRHVPLSELDKKFIRIFGSHFADKVQSILLRRQSLESLLVKATHDALTGLLNREAIMERLSLFAQAARRSKEPLSVALIDIDHFKSVNDRFGHLAGDEVLRGVALRLKGEKRNADHFGRYGGEEFLLVLYPCDAENVRAAAERFRAAVSDEGIAVPEKLESVPVTVSIGTATTKPGGEGVGELLRRADEALYRSKDEGRNRVTVGG